MRNMRALLLAAAGLLIALATPAAAQQDYPNRPIRLIIPFPAGGSNDIVGRAIAQQMGDRLGKQVIVDNRTGAGGVIGTELAAHAPPDGYTILVISIAHSVNPWLYKLPYDPIKAFAPIGIMGTGTNVLTVHPSLPANSLKDLLAMAKEKPGELSYASAGIGTFQHLGAELFRLDAKVNLLHVPFRGGGPPWSTCWAATTRSCSPRSSRRCRTSRPAGCGRSAPAARSAFRRWPTCRRSRRPACPATRR